MEKELIESILKSILEDFEKKLPEDVVKDLHELASIQTEIQIRIRRNRLLTPTTIDRYNELCIKHFMHMQDEETDKPKKKERPKPEPDLVIPNRRKPKTCGGCLLMDPGRNGDPDWCNLLHVPVVPDGMKDTCPLTELKKVEEFRIL